MENFKIYFENLDYYAIADLIVCLACLVLGFLFFYHKRALKVFFTTLALVAVKLAADILNSYLPTPSLMVTSMVMRGVLLIVFFSMAVVYQSDLRSIFQRIATPSGLDLFSEGFGSDDEVKEATDELLSALLAMAKQDIGAIVIIAPTTVDAHILETGTTLNAKVSAALLVSIFNTKAPLHDGAVIIRGNKILSAGCFLPLSQTTEISKELGTRHRAAIGITEESDVLAIVVSEETGIISIASHGQLQRYMTIEKLKERIERAYGITQLQLSEKQYKRKFLKGGKRK